MTQTGESYQMALSRLRRERQLSAARGPGVDLLAVEYFGSRLIVATFAILGDLSCVVTSADRLWQPVSKNPLFGLRGRRDSN